MVPLTFFFIHHICTCFASTITHSVLLSPNHESEGNSNITKLEDVTTISGTPDYWSITATDSCGMHMKIALGTAFAFHPTETTKLIVQIGSNANSNDGLLVTFGQPATHSYLALYMTLDGGGKEHRIYAADKKIGTGYCDNTYPYTQSYAAGDVQQVSLTANCGTQYNERRLTIMEGSEFFAPSANLIYPLTFVLENHPMDGYLAFEYTDDGTAPVPCGFTPMLTDSTMHIYLATDDIGHSVDITYINITRQYQSSNDPTNTSMNPTHDLTNNPTIAPTIHPTKDPTIAPTIRPTKDPTIVPTIRPTKNPTNNPIMDPTSNPTISATNNPAMTSVLTRAPTYHPTNGPTPIPNAGGPPTDIPSNHPTARPSEHRLSALVSDNLSTPPITTEGPHSMESIDGLVFQSTIDEIKTDTIQSTLLVMVLSAAVLAVLCVFGLTCFLCMRRGLFNSIHCCNSSANKYIIGLSFVRQSNIRREPYFGSQKDQDAMKGVQITEEGAPDAPNAYRPEPELQGNTRREGSTAREDIETIDTNNKEKRTTTGDESTTKGQNSEDNIANDEFVIKGDDEVYDNDTIQ